MKLLEAIVDNSKPQLVISALQIVPREQLGKLVLQRFEESPLGRAVRLIVDSLSETELVYLAFMSLLGEGKLLFITFMFNTLSPARREEVIKGIQQKEGLT